MVTSADPVDTPPLPSKSIVLVGLMGAGKSSVGRRLAQRLDMHFVDADREIEDAAGCTISEFFERFGEAEFRRGEERVIQRIISGPPVVLATGGGAFMSEETRSAISRNAISLWLKADIDVLFERVSRRQGRPLLAQQDPKTVLEKLMKDRYPFYEKADLWIESRRGPIEATVDSAHDVLMDHFKKACKSVPAE